MHSLPVAMPRKWQAIFKTVACPCYSPALMSSSSPSIALICLLIFVPTLSSQVRSLSPLPWRIYLCHGSTLATSLAAWGLHPLRYGSLWCRRCPNAQASPTATTTPHIPSQGEFKWIHHSWPRWPCRCLENTPWVVTVWGCQSSASAPRAFENLY